MSPDLGWERFDASKAADEFLAKHVVMSPHQIRAISCRDAVARWSPPLRAAAFVICLTATFGRPALKGIP